MSAGRQIRQASKQTIENEQCRCNPPEAMPQANINTTWGLPESICLMRAEICYIPLTKIRTVPVRSKDGDVRLGDRFLLRARAGVTARAAGAGKGRQSVPIEGRWWFAGVDSDRPTTHARACVASSLPSGSDRRVRVSTPAQAGLRMNAAEEAGCEVPGAGVKTRRCAGVSCSTCWGYRRRCRVAPASSGFDYPGAKAKARTRVHGADWVRSLRPVGAVSCRGLRCCRHGATPCHRACEQVEAQRHCLRWGAPPGRGQPSGRGHGECGREAGGSGVAGGGAQRRQGRQGQQRG